MVGACLQLLLILGHVEDTAGCHNKELVLHKSRKPMFCSCDKSSAAGQKHDSQRTTRKRWYLVKVLL